MKFILINMKKYYYYKTPVNLGDVIDYNGWKIVLTEAIINANPNLFVVEEVKEILFTTEDGVDYYLNQDKKEYWLIDSEDNILREINNYSSRHQLDANVTLRFSTRQAAEECVKLQKEKKEREELLNEAKRKYPIGTKAKCLIGDKRTFISKGGWKWRTGTIAVETEVGYYSVYMDGKWAEIVKDKTLEDYENILLNIKGVFSRFAGGCPYYYSDFYQKLKIVEPKLYYTKVLQLIADDLNGDWKPDFENEGQSKYIIYIVNSKDIIINTTWRTNRGNSHFESKELAQKAVEIMGDKLNLIFE